MSELLKSGAILHNTYRILRVIDQGGMGAIYMAENRQLMNEVCAVKEMLDNFSTPEERKEGLNLFEQEAKILHSLDHPNLPRLKAYFSENNRYYLVMAYIKGRTLESIVESTSDFIPESVVIRWCADLFNILEYLHDQDPAIIFRDLNPRNMMLEDGTGNVKLIDFGIARFFKAGKSSDTLSLGSPGYCPIEQYGRGQTDTRSDVYTVGATLYHILTKKVPIAAIERIKPTPSLLTPPRQINRRISANMEQVILKSMEINPDGRYSSIQEMRYALFPQQAPKTQKVSANTQSIGAAQSQTIKVQKQAKALSKPQHQPPKKQTTAQTQTRRKTGGPNTGGTASKRRGSPKLAWFVLLLVASMVIVKWLDGWRERDSGGNGTAAEARQLAVAEAVNDRVNFLAGDRTDWWQIRVAEAGSLMVSVKAASVPKGISLTLFDRNGRNRLEKAIVRNGRLEASIEVSPSTRILAQVMAPRIWDDSRYTIEASHSMAQLPDSLPLFAGPTIDTLVEPPDETRDIPNYPESDDAPDLELDTVTQAQLNVTDGIGLTWWRIRAPRTGRVTMELAAPSNLSPPFLGLYDEDENPLQTFYDAQERLQLAVLGGDDYLVKVFAQDSQEHIPYTVLARFKEDFEVFSGPDQKPDGAQRLAFQKKVEDSVSIDEGDLTDWWRVVMPEAGKLAIQFQADDADDVRLQVYRAGDVGDGSTLDEKMALLTLDGDQEGRIDGAAGAAYYLSVSVVGDSEGSDYDLLTSFLLDPEANSGPNATASGASPLPLNDGVRESLDYDRGDRTDWWRVSVPGPGHLTVTLSGRDASADLQLEVYDSEAEKLLEQSTTAAGREELSWELSDRGTYLVKVYAEAAGDASAYQLSTWFTVAPNANSGLDRTATGARELSVGRSARNSVNFDDGDKTDWWKVETPGPGTLVLELEADRFMADLNMNVYTSGDSTLVDSSSATQNSREIVTVDVKEKGWYYVEIYAHGAGDESKYRVTASFSQKDE